MVNNLILLKMILDFIEALIYKSFSAVLWYIK